ncbi:MAG: site-specific DNA-methyltransferase, partial [Promethearchaeota archaeon]
RLWKKKKFIINTHYVITLDKIKEYAGDKFLEELIEEILNKNNTQQLAEWEQLVGVKVKKKSDLWQNDAPQETKWKKLTIDTRYFDDRFKWKLLEALTEKFDLDEIIDGILIKSENWQALNLLLEKYYEKIKLIYIDPPYNTGSDEFLYKDNYQHSSWLTMMENRLRLAQRLLAEGRSIYVSIDDNELDKLKMLLEKFFKFQRIITWDTASLNVAGFKVQKQSWIRASDYILYFSKGDNSLFKMQYTPRSKEFIKKHYKYKDDKGIYRITRRGNKIYKGDDPGEPLTTVWKDILSFNYVAAAADEGLGFSTQKPQALLKRIIESSSDENEVVLDFFAGSGTTLVAAHKLKRKYIGIEMADYFDRILIPRMKKVLFGEQSGISKKVNWRGGGFFKYHTLEQYEDSIENIEFKSGHKALYDFTDYFIKYMLEWETKDSRTFLNIGELLNPFNYKIKILENYQEKAVNVDLIETLNYLLGLKVIKYKIIRQKDSKRNYIFVFGKKENTKIAIVWRNINDINFEKDREIIESTIQKFQPDEIYINRDALVEGFRPIEPQFKALMFKEIF